MAKYPGGKDHYSFSHNLDKVYPTGMTETENAREDDQMGGAVTSYRYPSRWQVLSLALLLAESPIGPVHIIAA